MAEIKSWLANNSNLSNSPSRSSHATASSQETHSTPALCEDTSFNSLESNASPSYYSKNDYPFPESSISQISIASFKTSTPQITCLAVHNNNVLYAASANQINVFDLISYSIVDTFGSSSGSGSGSGSVKCITFGEDKIFTAHQDCKIRVWKQINHTKHQLISTLPTLKDRFFKCIVPKNYVQVRRHKHKLWIEHADAVSGLVVDNGVGLMYSVSWDKSFKIWNVSSNPRCLESVKAHSDAINAIVVNSIDGTIYTGSADGSIKVWITTVDRMKPLLRRTLLRHESSVNALALTSDGSTLYSGGGDKDILVWERDDEQENDMLVTCSFVGHRGAILCLGHKKGVVVSGSSDGTVRIWKHGKGYGACCLGIIEGHCKPVKSLVVVAGGDSDSDEDSFSVLSGSLDGEIRVWKIMNCDDLFLEKISSS